MKKHTIQRDPDELELFLAKKGEAWLLQEDPVGQQLLDGNDHGADIKEMIRGEKVNSRWTTQEWWGKNRMPAPTEMEPIHVLVVVPAATMIRSGA
ncbi:hypothetical protein PC129_g1062 [Phytophthora cactorum]|uniref:Crinkler effector protein N-terminal domain-containing protein n=1 Tax=Phytophthora cactorum TaxID=29920 RepID=A0A329SYT0_9STRA|nr:hypothetical protein Pcac1_g15450 [Phytophthora cactorum]KAG2838809.1 hypothetical protein PC112_g4369 [Phytophthora cactorum]KAG2840768.1 hypothetical protein PC111_g3356 [Phytophthora cactorum]KAG2864796.1 hypothetical protein PC113_g4261 [Phytophthora cactorum]KAG2923798.1 hypothetical protein PC114_g4679 [Phytophthora cactorum]